MNVPSHGGLRVAVAVLIAGCGTVGPIPPERGEPLDVIPTPQYAERVDTLLSGATFRVVAAEADPKIALAARMLRGEPGNREQAGEIAIHLATRPGFKLDSLDRETLSPGHFGQSYVLRATDPGTIWIVGEPQGILYGAMTLLQLARNGRGLPAVHIRDFPHFEYRAAADWLLNGEVNRSSLDRGRGWEGFEALAKRGLDRCLRYKINVAWFDGFGAGLDKRAAEYPAVMRRLNAYARERGIHLVFGTYGASYGFAYQMGPLYEDAAYLGEVFLNRESYPDGAVYPCMGYVGDRSRRGVVPATLGSCRGNDELNRLKARELQDFIRAVEPGAIYIHHEDFGHARDTGAYWKKRCARCRARWPNDDLAAPDGGAGGLAHGYGTLIDAVNAVKNPTGYVASRDCRIFLTSPVYIPDDETPEAWARAMAIWKTIGRALPPASNVLVCFRETFGAGRWADAFSRATDLKLFLFFAGGGDHWINDDPFVATPVMNSHFLGASLIYNFNGDGYQEPQQLLNAEYSWNARSTGFFKDPASFDEGLALWRRAVRGEYAPAEIFDGFLRRACERLYGERVAVPMAKYYTEHRELGPDAAPMSFKRVYAIPAKWRTIVLDSKTWGPEIDSEKYLGDMRRLGLDRAEVHRRLKRTWELTLEMSMKGEEYLKEALEASPGQEDLRFFLESERVIVALSRALIEFHEALRLRSQQEPKLARGHFSQALPGVQRALALAGEYFPHPIDPTGEVGTLKTHLVRLKAAVERFLAER